MIELRNISKTYHTNGQDVEALKGVSLTINDGDVYGIIGMSGAGKSTLVRCINMLERPDSGEVVIDGKIVNNLSKQDLRLLRRDVAMIFQQFNLLLQATCLKNVMFPLECNGEKKEVAIKRAHELLKMVGLDDKADSYPANLSGGQKQRVAIARALASNPKILLCDEATSALDPQTTNSILVLIRDINQRFGITCVVITHQMSVIESICNRVAILDDGKVAEEGLVSDIFSHPSSLPAKLLVFPEFASTSLLISTKELFLRVVFNGATSAERPLIASLAVDEGVMANITYASIKNINGRVYGSLLLGLENESDLNKASSYLNAVDGVSAMEFSADE